MAAEGHLVELAEAVADGRVIDWENEELSARTPEERAVVHHLRLLAGVAGVHRSTITTPLDARDLLDAANEVTSGTWGPLEIKECIGGGSFGMVYRAWDPRLARDVALKLLRRQPDDVQASSIIEEGRLLARIRHPHVITVYGASRFDDRVGIWMEYIRGRTLERVIAEDGAMGAREAALVGSELCSALAAVHGQGVVHRDIKAHNVMRQEGGRLVLMDFGAGEDPFAPSRPGSIAGTPLYMAPELFTGSKATPSSDLYSLGVLMFRLVTGKYPVNGKSVDQVRAAHERNERLHLRDVRPDLPPGFVKAVERAMAPNPAERFDSAGAFEAALGAEVLSDSARSGEIVVAPPKRSWRWIAAAAVVAALVAGGWFVNKRDGAAPATGATRTIAVRPFKNLTGDTQQQYFVAGLSEGLFAQLGRLQALRVVALSEPAAGAAWPSLEETAVKLPNAYALFEGSVGRGDGQVRVTARLVQLASGALLWGKEYYGTDADKFALQGQVAADLAQQLHISISEAEATRLAAPVRLKTEAQDAYLKGRYLLDSLNTENLKEAKVQFELAIAFEPQYAAAHANLALTLMALGNYGVLTPAEVRAAAPAAAANALKYDPTSAEVALAVADVHFRLNWNWALAEPAYRSAIALNPSYMEARTQYASFLAAAGRLAEGLRESEEAEAIDALSAEVHSTVLMLLYYNRRYDDVIRRAKERLSNESNRGRIMLARGYAGAGKHAEAIAEMQKAIKINSNTGFEAALAVMYADAGNPAEARRILGSLETRRASGVGYVAPQDLGYILVALGDRDGAIARLNEAVDEQASRLLWLGVDPRVDKLRGDPRFVAILKRLGIPSTAR